MRTVMQGMLGRRAAAVIAAGALAVAGLVATSGGAAADPPWGQITGVITDAATNAPVAGVCVAYAAPGEPAYASEDCSDAEGRYTVDYVSAGRWVLVSQDTNGVYAGYVSAPFDFEAGQVLDRSFQVSPGGAVTGRVVDAATGEPIVGICPSAQVGRTDTYVLGQAAVCSDLDGRWTMGGLPRGRVTVVLGGNSSHVPVWLPDAAFQKSAKIFAVELGRRISVGTVKLHHGAELAGRITTRGGRPVVGAIVELGNPASRCGSPCGPFSDETDANGRYRITNIQPTWALAGVSAQDEPLAYAYSPGVSNPDLAKKLYFGFDRHLTFNAVMQPEARLHVTAIGADETGRTVNAVTPGDFNVGDFGYVYDEGLDTLLGHLPGGSVALKVTDDETEQSYWYGGATLDKATKFTLVPGRTTEVTIDLR
jgi:hypothetical protein